MYDIHSPHTRGDRRGERWRLRRGISIHSCEGRQQQNAEGAVEQEFQSAPLMRGETVGDVEHAHRVAISIHSPHARGDTGVPDCRSRPAHFNPLPSHEGRPALVEKGLILTRFQSTPLTRGETRDASTGSIAASYFNPLPSHEGRRKLCNLSQAQAAFQSTPLIRGETPPSPAKISARGHFNPLPSYEGRRLLFFCVVQTENFNPLPSHEGRPLRR